MKVVFIVIALSLFDESTKAAEEANLALKKPAFQYDVRSGGVASRGVDGDNSGEGDGAGTFSSGSCAATTAKTNTWFAVDLQNVYSIKRVAIVNRADQEDTNMKDFLVAVANFKPPANGPLPTSLLDNVTKDTLNDFICHSRTPSMPKGGPTELKCNQYVEGRYVYIIFKDTTADRSLFVCELYVYGDLATTTTDSSVTPKGGGNHGSSPSLTTMILAIVVGVIYTY